MKSKTKLPKDVLLKQLEINEIAEVLVEANDIPKPKKTINKFGIQCLIKPYSSKNDDVLKKNVAAALDKLLQPESVSKSPKRKKRFFSKICTPDIKLPYTCKTPIIDLPRKTKSSLKKRTYRTQHLATYATIKKLLKIHKERKMNQAFETPLLIQVDQKMNITTEEQVGGYKSKPKSMNTTTNDELEYYSAMNKSGKKPEEYQQLNRDVAWFAKNYEKIKHILENTLRLQKIDQNLFIPSNGIKTAKTNSPVKAISKLNPSMRTLQAAIKLDLSKSKDPTPKSFAKDETLDLPKVRTHEKINPNKAHIRKSSNAEAVINQQNLRVDLEFAKRIKRKSLNISAMVF